MLTEEQRQERMQGLTGRDIASYMGVNKYETPYQCWERKCLGKKEEDPSKKELFRWAHLTEDKLLEHYAQTYPIYSVKQNKETHYWEKNKIFRGHADGFAHNRTKKEVRLIECKMVNQYRSDEFGEPGTDDVPLDVLLQGGFYSLIYDTPVCDFPVTIGGNVPVLYYYERNKELEELIVQRGMEFWEKHILTREPPPVTIHDKLNDIFTCVSGKRLEASKDLYYKVLELKRIKEEAKELSKIESKLGLEIKLAMQDAELLTYEGAELATHKTQTTRRFDQKAFQKDNESVFETYKKESKTNVLRLKKGI
jgi:predicted phage-related endonuclease